MKKIILLSFIFLFKDIYASVYVNEGFWITESDKALIDIIKSRPEFTVDHTSKDGFELYGPIGLEKFLLNNNISYNSLSDKKYAIDNRSGYLTFNEIENELKSLANQYPNLSELYSIGKSVKKKDLWVMKLSSKNKSSDQKPEFKFIANMHGDEIVGRELMMRFIKECLINYNTDNELKNLLDNVQIHILVTMNPDGAEKTQRGNAKGVDLNRDFPDFDSNDNADVPSGRAPETQAVMQWQKKHNFKLSANFHGGAEVVNYPWDTVGSRCPQDDLVKSLSLEYAQNAPYIGTSTVFDNGITNGFDWYEVKGGMQDWSLYYRNDIQLTLEVSNIKWPQYSTIDYYYQQNRKALINFITRIGDL